MHEMNRVLVHQKVLRKLISPFAERTFKCSKRDVNIDAFKKNKVHETAHVDKYKKKLAVVPVSDTAQVFVLSTGSYGMGRSVLLKTDYDRYLFNCGEGTSKIITDVVPKAGPLKNIFFTSNTWNHIGGVFGLFMLTNYTFDRVDTIRFHGPPNIDKLLKLMKEFTDGKGKNIASIDVRGIDNVKYEDNQLSVEYVELLRSDLNQRKEETTDIKKSVMCYIIRLKELTRKVDVEKLAALKTPSGPWIKQLVNGETVALPDGRIIKSEDVMLEKGVGPMLVLDCPSADFLEPLITNKQLLDLQTDDDKPVLMVHMAPAGVVKDPRYVEFMGRFQSGTTHLMMNENSPCPYIHVSQMFESVLNRLHPGIFPTLQGYYHNRTKPTPTTDNIVQAYYGLAYKVRPASQQGFNWNDLVCYDNKASFKAAKNASLVEDTEMDDEITKLHQEIQQREVILEGVENEYPEIVFLGSGSGYPTSLRNASSILLQLRKDEYFLMDCGEGTLLQMYQMYGLEKTNHILCNLKGLFVSHHHYDHHMGFFGILEAHMQVMSKYRRNERLTIFAPTSLKKWHSLYSRYVSPIDNAIEFVPNESIYIDTRQGYTSDLIKCKENQLNVSKLIVMAVDHLNSSFGISIKHIDGWKLVYSGDCMPSDELIKYGKDCDILIHEGTFDDTCEKEAHTKRHSTTGQAIEVGKKMNASYTILTHFSQKYPRIPEFTDNFTENIGFSFDFMQVRPSQLGSIHLLKPALIKLYKHSYRLVQKKSNLSKRQSRKKQVDTKSLKISKA